MMHAIIYLCIIVANYLFGLAVHFYDWLWKNATTFSLLVTAYVLFEGISILLRNVEQQTEVAEMDTRMIIQGYLMKLEGRLAGIESKLDRLERVLGE